MNFASLRLRRNCWYGKAAVWGAGRSHLSCFSPLFPAADRSFRTEPKEKRQHQEYHDECRRACADVWFCEKEKRYTDQRTAAEADKLPLREVEQEFGFDMG